MLESWAEFSRVAQVDCWGHSMVCALAAFEHENGRGRAEALPFTGHFNRCWEQLAVLVRSPSCYFSDGPTLEPHPFAFWSPRG